MKKTCLLLLFQICLICSAAAQTIEFSNIEIEEKKEVVKVHKKKYTFALLNYGFYGGHSSCYSNDDYIVLDAPKLSHSIGFTVGQVRQWGWFADVQFGTHMNVKENLSTAQPDDKTFASTFSITPGLVVRCGIPLYASVGIGYGFVADHIIYHSYPYEENQRLFWVVNDDIFGLEEPNSSKHTVAWSVGLIGIIPYNITVSAKLTGIGSHVGAQFGLGYAFELPKDKQ